MANGIQDMFSNPLFLQYLSAAGQDISAGGPIGQNVGRVTEQNIAARSQAKLQNQYLTALGKMLSGDIPEGGKVTMDNKGLKIDVPKAPTAPETPPSAVAPGATTTMVNPFL